MPSRSRFVVSRLIACFALLVLIQGPAFLQVVPVDYAAKYPGIEGLYEVPLPGDKTTVMQIYFKDGSLRTLDSGDRTSDEIRSRRRPGAPIRPRVPREGDVPTRVPQGRAGPLHEVPGHQ